jgi:5-methylcytosine-specific restriction endonuclease McrA
MTGIDKKLAKRFEEFLQAGGAEILKTSNPWELARFRSANGICVVYQKANGKVSYSNEHAHNAYTAFIEARKWTAGEISERIRRKTVEELLFERDGVKCFFCDLPFSKVGNPPTLEHLLAISDGGNNHLSNLCLAHEECNKAAANLSIVEKVKLRDQRGSA